MSLPCESRLASTGVDDGAFVAGRGGNVLVLLAWGFFAWLKEFAGPAGWPEGADWGFFPAGAKGFCVAVVVGWPKVLIGCWTVEFAKGPEVDEGLTKDDCCPNGLFVDDGGGRAEF